MLLDAKWNFGAKTLTSSGAFADQVDEGSSVDIGTGEPLEGVFVITTAVSGGTDIEFEVQASADGSTWYTLGSIKAPVSELTEGKVLTCRLGGGRKGRYYRAYATVNGSPTAGAAKAHVQVQGVDVGDQNPTDRSFA